MRPIASAVLAMTLLTAVSAAADEVATPEAILQRLSSDRTSEMAWGAYLAGKHGVQAAAPVLCDLLLPLPGRDTAAWSYVHRTALDALVRLDASAPTEVLLHHALRFPEPVVIILGREPVRSRAALLAIFDRGWKRDHVDPVTVACGNLLAGSRAPGLARRILPRVRIDLLVSVREDGCAIGIGGGAGGAFGRRRFRPPDGFPPVTGYDFVYGEKPGDRLVADGAEKVFARRYEVSAGPGGRAYLGSGGTSIRIPRRLAPDWIGQLLGRRQGFEADDVATVAWVDAESFVREAAESRDRVLRAYWSALADLVSRKLLEREEAVDLEPAFSLRISDNREDDSVPLPPLPPTKVRSPFLK